MFAYAELISELNYRTAVAIGDRLVVGNKQLLIFDLENLNQEPLDLRGKIKGFVTNVAKCPNGLAVIETSCGIGVYCLYYVYPEEGDVQKICQTEIGRDMIFHILTCSGGNPERDIMMVAQDLDSEKIGAFIPEKEKMRKVGVDIDKAYETFISLNKNSQKNIRISMDPCLSNSILWWFETENSENVPATAFIYEKDRKRFPVLLFYDRNQDKAVGVLPIPSEYLNRAKEENFGDFILLEIYAGEGVIFVRYSYKFDLLIDKIDVARKETIAYRTRILDDITSTVVPLKPALGSEIIYGLANSSRTLKLLTLVKREDDTAYGFTSGAVYESGYETMLYMMRTASIGKRHIVISDSGVEGKKTFVWKLKENYLVRKHA